MTELTFTTATGAELAYQALDAALAHRKAFDMSVWANSYYEWDAIGLEQLTNECGTTACLAGWAVALRGLKVTNDGLVFTADERHAGVIWNMAVELLEITDVEGDRLFHAPEHRISEVVAEVFGPRPEPAS